MAICASCGTNNVDGTKFCVQCGATIAPQPGAWRTPTEELNDQSANFAKTVVMPPGTSYDQPAPQPPPPPMPMPTPAYGGPAQPMAYGQLNYAQWVDRVLAGLIDGGINVAIMVVLFILFGVLAGIGGAVGGDNNPLPGGIFCFGTFIAMLSVFGFGLYNKIYLVSKRGSSIGQKLINLRVVDASGNTPAIGTLVLRLLVQVGLGIVPFLGWLLVLLDLLFPLWDEKRQTIHDKAAGTFVIKTA